MRIVVVTEQPLIELGLRQLLLNEASVQLQRQGSDYFSASGLSDLPQLVMVDLDSAYQDQLSLVAQLRQSYPPIRMLVMAAHFSSALINRVLQLGANGVICKSQPTDIQLAAIRAVIAGQLWLPNEVEPQADPQLTETFERINSLSPRQLKILSLFAEGMMNKQIATHLHLSEATVKAHASAIFLKLGVRTRTQAVIAYQQSGLVSQGALLSPVSG